MGTPTNSETTALAKDKKQYSSESTRLLLKASKLEIKNSDHAEKASEFLSAAKKTWRAIEEKRLQYTAPLNKSLKAINADANEMKEPFTEIEKIIKRKLVVYHDNLEAEQRRQEEALKEEEETEEVPTMESMVKSVDVAPKNVKTSSGSASFVKFWDFELENIEIVPAEYRLLDEKKVRQAVANGVRKLPGVKIFENKRIVSR